MKILDALEKVVNEQREKQGLEKIKLVRCKPVQICANGRHKDVTTGKFCK